jgi:tetratricopeptide (TPR) repeat protein
MRGRISAGVLIAIVRALHAGLKSGILEVVHGEQVRKVLFQKGIIKFATTSLPQERLGEYLARNTPLTKPDIEKAAKHVGRGERLGQILVRMGLLSAEDLTRLARDHILEIIFNTLAVKEGEYRFEEVEVPLGQEIKAGLSVAGIIMEVVRRIEPAEAMTWLNDQSMILQPSTNEHLRSQPISLGPQEGFLMSRADGRANIGEIIAVSPLPAAETLRTLLGLWCAGLLENPADPLRLPFKDAPAIPAPPAAKAQSPPAQGGDPTRAAAPQQTPPKPAPAASKATPSAPARSAASRSRAQRSGAALRREIVRRPTSARGSSGGSSKTGADKDEEISREIAERFKTAQDQNFYEMLGVLTTADESDVRRAYYGFAKRLHPDRFQAPQFELVRKQAEQLFAMLTEAYNILCDPQTRKQYDEQRAEPVQNSPAEQKQEQADMARQNFLYGKVMLQKGKFHEAVKFFENAVQLDDHKAEYHQYLGSVQMKNPKWRRDAARSFAKALEIDPSLVSCYVNLGSIYVRLQQLDKAEKMFRTALQWDPDQPVAKRELERMEGSKSGTGVSSMFKGIFKK